MKNRKVDLDKEMRSDKSISRQVLAKKADGEKLQDFYSSVFGTNQQEIKNNARIMRRKIYFFGLIVLIIVGILYFFVIGNITFVNLTE